MKELEKLLAKAGIDPMKKITLRQRVMSLLETLDYIDMQRDTIKTCGSLIVLAETQDAATDKMEQNQENNKEFLRGLKNSFRFQEAALHEAMRDTDEV